MAVERILTVTLSIGVTYDEAEAGAAGLDFEGESTFAYMMADIIADELRDSMRGYKLKMVGDTKYLTGTVEDVQLDFDLTNVGVAGRWSEDVTEKEEM